MTLIATWDSIILDRNITYVSFNFPCVKIFNFDSFYCCKTEAKWYFKCMRLFCLVVGWGSKCCGEVMHGKCSWNTTRSQRKHEQGGWWCSKRRQKAIAPGHFLKALFNLTHVVILSNTLSTAWCFSTKQEATTAVWRRKGIFTLPVLGRIVFICI